MASEVKNAAQKAPKARTRSGAGKSSAREGARGKSAANERARKKAESAGGASAPKKNASRGKAAGSKSAARVSPRAKSAPSLPKRHNKPIEAPAEKKTLRAPADAKGGLEVVFLGGVGEIGKNMTALKYGGDIILIDCGSSFPTTDTPGVDLIIPDFSFVAENASFVRALFVTHGHEDHIGAIPYLVEKLPGLKIYASALSCALIRHKLDERGIVGPRLIAVEGGDKAREGNFLVEFIRVCHSISGAFALNVETPVGRVFHTGDFKVDYTPVDGQAMDLTRIAEIGRSGVKLMLGESTNVEKPGTTISERKVGETLERIFATHRDKRIIIATFASNVNRLQQIVDICESCGRKIVFNGRSMINVSGMARELGLLRIKEGSVIEPEEMHKHHYAKQCLITTGSQGEPMSALTRMAAGEDKIEVTPHDLVVISSNPIPGNEKLVYTVINNLYRRGASVLYGSLEALHVSGHACQDELKLMLSLVKPEFFIPVHGEYRHLRQHEALALSLGMKQGNIAIAEIGSRFVLRRHSLKAGESVEAGNVYVDGLTDVDNVTLRDRRQLSNNGIVTVLVTIALAEGRLLSPPEVIARGLTLEEGQTEEVRGLVEQTIAGRDYKSADDRANFKRKLKRALTRYFDAALKQKPMILPIVIEV